MPSFFDIASVAAPLVGGLLGRQAAGRAADAQTAASGAAIGEQRRQFDLIRSDLAPFREQGVNALNQFAASVLGPLEETPAFQFTRDQGLKAIDQLAGARGKAFSGENIRGAKQFASGLASQEINNQLNRLAGLAGIGQTSTAQGGAFGAGSANAISQLLGEQGAARASGFVGQQNAISDSINNALLFGALRGL
ncbi:MAG: hypothetical protein ACR2RF_05930 [Geminicoccaceae bacterium]